MKCPDCDTDLIEEDRRGVRAFACAQDRGVAVTLPSLRNLTQRKHVLALWQTARHEGTPSSRACPACERTMAVITARRPDGRVELDACTSCQLVWFDRDELAVFAPVDEQPARPQRRAANLTPEAAEALAMANMQLRDQRQETEEHAHMARMLVASEGWGYRRGQYGSVINALRSLFS